MDCLIIEGEPREVTEIRQRIMDSFADLVFIEDEHKYYVNGNEVPSVSHFTHVCGPKFDEIAMSEKYAADHGETALYWRQKWHQKSFKATSLGTKVHAWGESYGWLKAGHPEKIVDFILPQYHKETNTLVTWQPKEEAIVKFMDDLPKSYHLVLNEARVYSGKNPDEGMNTKQPYAGTFDMLYYYDGDGNVDKAGLVIFDYKTNESLTNEYSRTKHRMLYPPFDFLYDESLGYYTLQLSCYQIPLEDIGLKVLGRKLIHLLPNGEYKKVDLQDVTKTIRQNL